MVLEMSFMYLWLLFLLFWLHYQGWPLGTPDLLLTCLASPAEAVQLFPNSSSIERNAAQNILLKPWASLCYRFALGLTDVKDCCVSLEILKHPEADLKVLCGTPGCFNVQLGIEGCWLPSPLPDCCFSPFVNLWPHPFLLRVMFGVPSLAFINVSLEVGYLFFLILSFLFGKW